MPLGTQLCGLPIAIIAASLFAVMGVAKPSGVVCAESNNSHGSPACFTDSGALVRPGNYREWVYLSSGMGVTYESEDSVAERPLVFDNVFVSPEAYAEFVRSGAWPEGAVFILEVRQAEQRVSIGVRGHTQGRLRFLEASVKDSARFQEGGWAYFSFDGPQGVMDVAPPLPRTAECYDCHRKHAALDNTFIQFYPTLLDIAERLDGGAIASPD